MVQLVVYNWCFGGFGYDESVVKWVRENEDSLKQEYNDDDVEELADETISGEMYDDGSGPKLNYLNNCSGASRDNELLATIVSGDTEYTGTVGAKYSELYVAEVPDGVDWVIDEYDGQETVKEKSRTFN